MTPITALIDRAEAAAAAAQVHRAEVFELACRLYPHATRPIVRAVIKELLHTGMVDTFVEAHAAALNLGQFFDRISQGE
jgi:hypothetical protein